MSLRLRTLKCGDYCGQIGWVPPIYSHESLKVENVSQLRSESEDDVSTKEWSARMEERTRAGFDDEVRGL